MVSAYCKAWPWAFPTWTCPLPHGGDERMMVESVALSPATYRALTLGACVFNRLTQPVDRLIRPRTLLAGRYSGRQGSGQAQRPDNDLRFGLSLPIQDQILTDPGQRDDFVRGIGAYSATQMIPRWRTAT